MAHRLIIFLLLFTSVLCHTGGPISTDNFAFYQKRLVEKLFEGYEEEVAPINTSHNDSDPSTHFGFKMELSLWAFRLIRVNEPEQKIDVIIECTLVWKDFRLSWNPEEHGGINRLYIQRAKVWVPDLTPINVVSASDIREFYQQVASLENNGTISLLITLTMSAVCRYDISAFPFDIQECYITMDVRSICATDYELKAHNHETFDGHNLGNGEWDVRSVFLKGFEYDTPAEDEFNSARIRIILQRKPTYYVLIFMLPTLIITGISIIGIFLTGTDILSRVSVGLSSVISMSFLLGVLNVMLPKTDQFPLLGLYFLLQFLLIGAGLLLVLVFSNKKVFTRRGTSFHTIQLYHIGSCFLQITNVGAFISFCTWLPKLLEKTTVVKHK